MLVIGIDIGTTSICMTAMNAQTGKVVVTIASPNNSRMAGTQPWAALQSSEIIYQSICELLIKLEPMLEEEGNIAAIGIASQMHGILYLDREGTPLSPLMTWQDQRGEVRLETGNTYTAELAQKTGYSSFATGFGLVSHYYNVHNGLVPVGSVQLCTIGDYIAMRLGGSLLPLIDITHAAGLGLYSLQNGCFDRQAMVAAGIDSEIVPKVVPSHTIVGYWREQIPVITAIGDNQASFLGAVTSLSSCALVNVGTGAQISVFSDVIPSCSDLDARPFPGGGYLLVGASLSGGKSYSLLEQFFTEVCRTFTGIAGENIYQTMNELAKDALKDLQEPVKVRTQFYGTRTDPKSTGSFEVITQHNLTPRHLIAGVFNGMAEELLHYYQLIPEKLRTRVNIIIGSGNGLRANSALQLILQQQFELPLQLSDYAEEAALGAAIHAGVSTGLIQNYDAAIQRLTKGDASA